MVPSAGVFRLTMLFGAKEKTMSRTRDLVELAMGNVRVPVTELTMDERIHLFHVFGSMITRHYYTSRGGGLFREWVHQSLDHNNVLHDGAGLQLPSKKRFFPADESYNTATRVALLGNQMFRLPNFSQYSPKHWEEGTRLGFCRLCLTQDGRLWFERYEATVCKGTNAYVDHAEYQEISVSLESPDKPIPEELAALFEAVPNFLYRFCCLTLELTNEEAKRREVRAKRTRDLFTQISEIGKPFDISIVRH